MSIKQRKNQWTVGIVGGLISGTYMRFVDELAKALDDGDNMRVLPIVSHGAASNLDDVLYLRGIDIAVTQSDVFEYFRKERQTPNLQGRVHYIIRLPISEVHIVGRTEYRSLEDLRGKKVSFGPQGAGSSLTGAIIFQRLGINVEELHLNEAEGLRRLRAGEIAALVRVIGKPIDYFSKLPADLGILLSAYTVLAEIRGLLCAERVHQRGLPDADPEGATLRDAGRALPCSQCSTGPKAATAIAGWERFIERLFTNWEKFQKPPFHPKWRDVNLAATVPGWTRYPVADEILQRFIEKRGQSKEFQAFMDNQSRDKPRNDSGTGGAVS